MEEVKIIFKDGTELTVERNGSSFITDEKPTFPEDLKNITIEGQTISNGRVIECASVDGRYWFAITEIPQDELDKAAYDDALAELTELIATMM